MKEDQFYKHQLFNKFTCLKQEIKDHESAILRLQLDLTEIAKLQDSSNREGDDDDSPYERAPLIIAQGQCIINISLSCLYHDFKKADPLAPPMDLFAPPVDPLAPPVDPSASPIQPQTLLPDPIP
ncbi:29397_t:CDS:2, partial [Gigaspora margarita]